MFVLKVRRTRASHSVNIIIETRRIAKHSNLRISVEIGVIGICHASLLYNVNNLNTRKNMGKLKESGRFENLPVVSK